MNKFLLILGIISFHVKAEAVPDAVLILESKTHRGVKLESTLVIIKNDEVIVNGEKLSPTEIITQSSALTEISKFPASEKGLCEAGVFRHLYKKAKIIKIERGCLGSSRYNHLMKNFLALKKDALIK